MYRNNINGVIFNLVDDCDTLSVKLKNILDDMYMDVIPYDASKVHVYETDLLQLERAIESSNNEGMLEILLKYHTMFRRYR